MDNELLQSFFTEASESLSQFEEALAELEQNPNDSANIDAVFRVIHTIKGNSSFLDLDAITKISHVAETLLDEVRQGKRELTEDCLQALFVVLDDLRVLILQQNLEHNISPSVDLLNSILQGDGVANPTSAATTNQADAGIPRDSLASNSTRTSLAGTDLAGTDSAKADTTVTSPSKIAKKSLIRIEEKKLNKMVDLVTELEVIRHTLESLPPEFEAVRDQVSEAFFELDSTVTKVARVTNELNRMVLGARLVPVNNVFQRFPRVVKDLARKLGKEINLIVQNGSAELDKTIVDAVADPMTHMIRNACDHGIEPVAERRANGKPDVGTVVLNSYVHDNFVVIEIRDDGKGIDGEKMAQIALKKGIVSAEKIPEMTKQEKMGLIFAPGFSSAEAITDISGRGVGMDVVKQNINQLKGTVIIDSEVGKGTVFRLRFPLSMTVMRCLFIRVLDSYCAVSLNQIDQSVDYSIEEIIPTLKPIAQKDNKTEYIPIYFLEEIFWDKKRDTDSFQKQQAKSNVLNKLFHTLIIPTQDGKFIGFVVSQFNHIEQVIVHSVDSYISSIPGVQGSVIQKDGSVALTLDLDSLIESARKMPPFGYAPKRSKTEGAEDTLSSFLEMSA